MGRLRPYDSDGRDGRTTDRRGWDYTDVIWARVKRYRRREDAGVNLRWLPDDLDRLRRFAQQLLTRRIASALNSGRYGGLVRGTLTPSGSASLPNRQVSTKAGQAQKADRVDFLSRIRL